MQLKAFLITAALSSLAVAAPAPEAVANPVPEPVADPVPEPMPSYVSPPSKGPKPPVKKGATVELNKECHLVLNNLSECSASTTKAMGKVKNGKCVQSENVGAINSQEEGPNFCGDATIKMLYTKPDQGIVWFDNGYDHMYEITLPSLKPGTKVTWNGKDWK